ncbi:MAG: hypothetical protein C0594_04180, partial [Marinilabiliales bacterium]
MTISLILIAVVSFLSCNVPGEKYGIEIFAEPDSVFLPEYASLFRVEYYGNDKLLIIHNPWGQGDYDSIFVKKEEIPIQNVLVLSSVQMAFVNELDELESVMGIADSSYTCNIDVLNKVRSGKLIQFGDEANLSIEQIIQYSPDIICKSGWKEWQPVEKKMTSLGFKLVRTVEWMENTPLGRAEWIYFFASFYGKEELADSIFSSIAKKYNVIASSSRNQNSGIILHGWERNGAWYIPGSESYITSFYKDLDLNVFVLPESGQGSSTISRETIMGISDSVTTWIIHDLNDTILYCDYFSDWMKNIKAVSTARVFMNLKQKGKGLSNN